MNRMRPITFSPSVTLVVTRACSNSCLYCAFRKEGDGLVTDDEIGRVIHLAKSSDATEVLILSGERPDDLPHIASKLRARGFPSMVEFVRHICFKLLDSTLLPHINIGLLHGEELQRLKECCASMGLMVEGDYGPLSKRVQPQKQFFRRMAHLRAAGELKIPFTTGILLGMGETPGDRITSLEAVASIQGRYGHVQEVILQNYVPPGPSFPRPVPIPLDEMEELVAFVRQEMPGVHIQFPPNLNSHWIELLNMGFDDLGGMSVDEDAVNPNRPWPVIDDLEKSLVTAGFQLNRRLPLYPEFHNPDWQSACVGQVVRDIVAHRRGYGHYHTACMEEKGSVSQHQTSA